jgi:hypothetical protein
MGTGIREIDLHGTRVGRAVPARRNAEADVLSRRDRDIAPYLLLMLALSLLASGCKRETPQTSASTNAVAASTNGPLVSGRVILQGTPPPPRTIVLDAMCGKLHTNAVTEADYRVGEANGFADVFVYLQGVPEGVGATPEGEAPLLDQQGCLYTPKVFGVLVNQKFKIRNSDALMHNVHAVPKSNSEFNFAQPVKGQVNEKAFSKPEVLLRIKCDVHQWMNTYVGVVPHKFFAVTDDKGHFRLPGGLPAGKYTIEAVHPKAGRVAQEITVTAGENQPVELTLSPK